MLVTGAEREHPLPAHWMDSQAPCVLPVNTAPQVTVLSLCNKQSTTSSCFSAAMLLIPEICQVAGVHVFKIMVFVSPVLM